jgi:hypothetical protein
MPEQESRTLVLEEVRSALQVQRERRQNMETKGGILLGFLGGILALMMSGHTVLITLPAASRLLLIVTVAFLFAAIICLFFVTRPRAMRIDPDPRALAEKYRTLPYKDTVEKLLTTFVTSCEENDRVVETVATALKWAHVFASLGLTCLTFSLLLSLYG